MKALLICVLLVFGGVVAQAQSSTASLNIMLSDIQSVTLSSKVVASSGISPTDQTQNATIKLLREAASQVKKIWVKSQEYEKLARRNSTMQSLKASIDPKTTLASNLEKASVTIDPLHLVYQIDPL